MNVYRVDEGADGARLDSFLSETAGLTRSHAQRLIESGAVLVDGRTRAKNYRICSGNEIVYTEREPETCDVVPQNIPLDIVYEDDDIIVVNKPKGMVVHPAPGNTDGTLVNALLWHCGDSLSGINGVLRPGIVHRIDKNTSGLLMVAKNDRAHVFLAEQIKEHSFERIYETVVIGNMKAQSGTIDAPIGRHPTDRKRMAIVPGGRHAVTHYEVIRIYDGFSHLRVRLETGRTHQIRVHMASIGRPVLGDRVYGSGKNKFEAENRELLCGQCLHARTLGFIHPDGRQMSFTSELPFYFKETLRKLDEKEKNNNLRH